MYFYYWKKKKDFCEKSHRCQHFHTRAALDIAEGCMWPPDKQFDTPVNLWHHTEEAVSAAFTETHATYLEGTDSIYVLLMKIPWRFGLEGPMHPGRAPGVILTDLFPPERKYMWKCKARLA